MKSRITMIIACMLLAVTGIQAQQRIMADAFNKLLAGKDVESAYFSSKGKDADNGEWYCQRIDFKMPAVRESLTVITLGKQHKKLLDNVLDAYRVATKADNVSYAYICEQLPQMKETREHISFSIPYSVDEEPLIIGQKPNSSVFVITESYADPKHSTIYGMEWEYVLLDLQPVCKGSLFTVRTEKEIADVKRIIEGKREIAAQYQSELLRKLVFYRDKLKAAELTYRIKSTEVKGVCLIASSIARNGSVGEIEQAIPLVLEVFAYLHSDNNRANDEELLTAASEMLNNRLAALKNASASSPRATASESSSRNVGR